MKTVSVESNLSSFEDFHDGEWINKVAELVKDTDIDDVALEFASHWWGSARAFVLPWFLINEVYDGASSNLPAGISRQNLWNEYMKADEFRVALWKLSESMYCSIYYAYENLMVNLLQKITGIRIRVTDRDFSKKLIEVYGDRLANKIWNDNFISVSREIRNCIVHNGGKASSKLLEMKPLPHMKDENVLISASDTRNLYNTLKPIVYEILNESLKVLKQRVRINHQSESG